MRRLFHAAGNITRLPSPNNLKKAKPVLALLIFFSFMCITTIMFVAYTEISFASSSSLSASEMAAAAVDYINAKYTSGEKIDGYTAYVLSLAGEDLEGSKWTGSSWWDKDHITLKSNIEKLSDMLSDSSSLITYITATQNADGSFGPYANEYGSRPPLQALAMVKDNTVGTAVYSQVSNSIGLAVSYFKEGYTSGAMPYEVNGWSFDYRCVEALANAGEDLSASEWVYGGITLKDAVISSAVATAANPTVKNAVYLAKELIALNVVNPEPGKIKTLAKAIIDKQNTVNGKVYFGDSIYDDVVVLTALGKTGYLSSSSIDQAGALAYLNTFKHNHTNSWGSPAGAAWGGWDPEEADLTAQVLTALSYFDGAADQNSGVYQSIQDGLAYLADIQNPDTAAVTAQWDSTFSTAETLIALKSLGKSYDDYAGPSSAWVEKSRTKAIAQCLLALSQWEDDSSRRDRLVSLLSGRQKNADPGKGSFEDSVYSDMWAFVALGEAGEIQSINADDAKAYILSKQGEDGSWGEVFGSVYYSDVLSTYQAIRALTYFTSIGDQQVQAAKTRGLDYLKGLQQPDGGVYSTWDDPAVDNSELIVTLDRLGEDPAGDYWTNEDGLTPVDYLLNNTMQADGSFGNSNNVFGAAEALAAYLLVDGQGGNPGGGVVTPSQDEISIKVAVVGINGELLFGPDSVDLSKDDEYGCTALGALDATGLDYSYSNGLIKSIEGQANSGLNGWMYKVNDTVPAVSAKDKQVKEGDRVIWWYSEDINSNGPDWDDLEKGSTLADSYTTKNIPASLKPSVEALGALDKLARLLGLKRADDELGPVDEATVAVVVLNGDKLPPWTEVAALQKELAQSIIDLTVEVDAAKGATMVDKLGEFALQIPAGALSDDVEITVKKNVLTGDAEGKGAPAAPENFRLVSPVYTLGPAGTTFDEPVTLTLKIALPPLTRPENLVLAWYDQAKGKWIAIPAVVDARGLIIAKIWHFTDFAVLAGQEKVPFDDVTSPAWTWARDPIELMAGAGVIKGVDGSNFEPGRAISRAELTSILVKALRLPAAAGRPAFKDVAGSEWYAGPVAAAARAGLIKGYEDGTFRPDRTISREELVTVMVRALGLPVPSGEGPAFADSGKISPWARESVEAAVSGGLVKGYPDGAFRPDGTATRAECAVMVYRALAF